MAVIVSTLCTKNPTWIGLGSNPGLRGERPRTNCASHDTARYMYGQGVAVLVNVRKANGGWRCISTIINLSARLN